MGDPDSQAPSPGSWVLVGVSWALVGIPLIWVIWSSLELWAVLFR